MKNPSEHIGPLRAEINRIDNKLLDLIAQRLAVARQIGVVKGEHGLPVRDEAREAERIATLTHQAEQYGMHGDLVVNVWQELMAEARRVEEPEK